MPSPPEVGLVILDGPSVLAPLFINPEEDERAEETLTNPELADYFLTKKSDRSLLVGEELKLISQVISFHRDNDVACRPFVRSEGVRDELLLSITFPTPGNDRYSHFFDVSQSDLEK
ncbi:hypothetical protein Tco_0951817 [Tanacetum coccineum]|uniref:Uncharacterized protein n=1 Tax=Tanacetum coccineum TaxID=301880 RepID=A0ABQ5DVZ7_9ASTR